MIARASITLTPIRVADLLARGRHAVYASQPQAVAASIMKAAQGAALATR